MLIQELLTLNEGMKFRIEDSDAKDYADGIQFELQTKSLGKLLASKIESLGIEFDNFSEDGHTFINLSDKDKAKLKKLLLDLNFVEVKKF